MQMAICEGYIVVQAGGPPAPFFCSAEEGVAAATGIWHVVDYPFYFDVSLIDPAFAMAFYVGGWLVFGTPWIAAWAFSQFTRSVKNH